MASSKDRAATPDAREAGSVGGASGASAGEIGLAVGDARAETSVAVAAGSAGGTPPEGGETLARTFADFAVGGDEAGAGVTGAAVMRMKHCE